MRVAIAKIPFILLALSCAGRASALDLVTQTQDLGTLGAPDSLFYGHSFGIPLPAGLTSADTFYDDFAFVIPLGATYTSFTATLNLQTVLDISNLQARLYTGDLSQTTTGTVLSPQQLIQRWSATVGTGSGPMNVIDPVELAPGSYVLEVRGQVIGTGGGSYSGVIGVAAVPEPATYALFGCGLIATALIARRRACS